MEVKSKLQFFNAINIHSCQFKIAQTSFFLTNLNKANDQKLLLTKKYYICITK